MDALSCAVYLVWRESEVEHTGGLLIYTLLLLQMLGYEWEHCPLVGDQGTCGGLYNGTTDTDLFIHTFLCFHFYTWSVVILSNCEFGDDWFVHVCSSDQFCPLRRNHHHPGAEAAVAWYRRKWIEHLPVSHQVTNTWDVCLQKCQNCECVCAWVCVCVCVSVCVCLHMRIDSY